MYREITFLENMTGFEFLKFMSAMRGTKDKSLRNNLIDRLELDTSAWVRKMSKGMKQKLALVTAFMHDPSVYILDEPTSGLDPFMQNVFVEMIEEEKLKGKTVMMSSHIFAEVQRMCDRAGIIREGYLVAVEDIKSLNVMEQKNYIITLENPSDFIKLENSMLKVEKISDYRVLIKIKNDYDLFFKTLSNIKVSNLDVQEQTLEDIFMKYYGKQGDNNE